MKTHNAILTAFGLLAALPLIAGPRTSATYSIATEIADGGGARAASANYTHDGSVGGVAGISSAGSPEYVAKHGYIGQLYDVTGLTILPASPTVGEGGTVQMEARQSLDDATFLLLSPGSVAWSISAGPLTSVDAGGIATAGVVYEDTLATVRGDANGFTGFGDVMVIDVDPDNFGLYAGDGLPDWWQVGYFGVGNPLAAPGVDVTGNGQNNLFAYVADLDPTDHDSTFDVRIQKGATPAEMDIVFSPRKATRDYVVQQSSALAPASWGTLIPASVIDDGEERTVTDGDAAGDRNFYRVEISLP